MGWFSKKQQNVDWDINDIIDTKSKLQKFDEQWNTDTESQDLLTLPPHLSGSEIREQTEKFLQPGKKQKPVLDDKFDVFEGSSLQPYATDKKDINNDTNRQLDESAISHNTDNNQNEPVRKKITTVKELTEALNPVQANKVKMNELFASNDTTATTNQNKEVNMSEFFSHNQHDANARHIPNKDELSMVFADKTETNTHQSDTRKPLDRVASFFHSDKVTENKSTQSPTDIVHKIFDSDKVEQKRELPDRDEMREIFASAKAEAPKPVANEQLLSTITNNKQQ